jgi:predicted GNAT superfamily acetyltransferase
MRSCVALQKDVWNFSDAELVPLRMFVVAEKIGGQVIGGFDDQELVAFAFAIPGYRNGRSYLHSHMLAVRDSFRNTGLGQRMKWFQREEALNRGIDLIEWTFDPLEIKNSYLNIEKLGAIARRYNVNQYGITASPLQWWLNSERVLLLLDTGHRPRFTAAKSIAVPAKIYEWKSSLATRGLAREVQNRNRAEFERAFRSELAVMGYDRESEGSGKFLLGAWHDSQEF